MRRVTRNFILGMGVVLALLLSLGAVPSYLQSGEPYYLTATPVEGEGGAATANGTLANASATNTTADANATVVDAATLSAQRYPYTTEALDDAAANGTGQSAAYYRGPIGIKGAFTHSPFDEYDALAQRYPNAVDGDGVRVSDEGMLYRLAVTRQV